LKLTTLVIADDQELLRTTISWALSQKHGYQVVGQAASSEEAVLISRVVQPDVVIIDTMMPGIGGIEATRKILACCKKTKVIALTGNSSDVIARQVIAAGAMGCITKNEDFEEIHRAITTVLRGEIYLSNVVAQQIAKAGLAEENDKQPFEKLSDREMQTAIMISRGERVQAIAAMFSISPKTVNTYRYRIFEKLGITTDVSLSLLAVKHNLLEGNLQQQN
jgi:two-component system invasion response regulator UvrY